jgi:pimeloyl-ACP methyl ester carboxylesterase
LGIVGCAEEAPLPVEDLRRALGVPFFRNPLEPQLEESWKHRDLVFERVRFQGRYGDWIPALICYSELARSRPLPALLCMPGNGQPKEDFLRSTDLLPRWAEEGFFVISIDRPYHGGRAGDLRDAITQKGLLNVWGESVYDLMRVLDYLQTRQEVVGERIGMLGMSLGGVEALLLAAMDTRVKVVVSVAGQLVWEEIFRGEGWKSVFHGLPLRNQLVEAGASGEEALQAFRRTYPDWNLVDAGKVAPRICPRPLLLLVGEEDPLVAPAAGERTFNSALPYYADLGKEELLQIWVVPKTAHRFPPVMQTRAIDWFKRWL